jgi:hypothetical protein
VSGSWRFIENSKRKRLRRAIGNRNGTFTDTIASSGILVTVGAPERDDIGALSG